MAYLAVGSDNSVLKQQWARMCSKQAALRGDSADGANPERAAKRRMTDAAKEPLKPPQPPGTLDEKAQGVPRNVACLTEVRSNLGDWESRGSEESLRDASADEASPKSNKTPPTRPSPEDGLAQRSVAC